MTSYSTQLDLALELLVPQAFPADGVPECISYNRLLLAFVPFEATTFFARFFGGDILQANHTLRKTPCKFARIVANDRFRKRDGRQKTI